jgi:hypothetical protein
MFALYSYNNNILLLIKENLFILLLSKSGKDNYD